VALRVKAICGSVLINGRPAARVTDAINCGGKMIVGSGDVIIGDKPTPKKPKKVVLPKIVFPNQSGSTPAITQADGSVIPPQKTNKPVFYTPPPQKSNVPKTTIVPTNVKSTALQQGKSNAVDYWQNIERNADNFPAALGAHLMKLNAEAGYSIAEGAKATYETLTDWDKFKAAAVGIKDSVVNYEETFQSLKESAQQFADLPADQQGDAAYKMLMGTLAGGAAAKGVGVVGKMGKTQLTKALSKPSTQDISLAKSAGTTAAQIAAREKVARHYLQSNQFSDKQIIEALGSSSIRKGGVDLSKPLKVISFPPPDTMTQYVRPHGNPGNWFDPLKNQSADSLGLNGATRQVKAFKIPEGTGLLSHSRPILDDWTVPSTPIQTKGGGVQLFVNDSIKKSVTKI